jgi:hypothetical protein
MRIQTSDHEFVEVLLLERLNPESTDFWGGNWLRARARVSSQGLHGAADTQVRIEELTSLADKLSDLHRTLVGQVEFWPLEPNLKLTFDIGKGGGLKVYAEIQPDLANVARMVLELQLDQTFLPGIVEQLRADLAPYPQVGQP